MIFQFLVVLVILSLVLAKDLSLAETDKCTSIIVGKLAGSQGPMTTHTADCSDCDFRINKVPARDWPAGTMRPLYLYKGSYPATVTSSRGEAWHPNNLEGTPEQIAQWGTESSIVGYIPEVAHTYALYEAGYGIMNEHQVAIGESTCAARFWAAPVTAGGKAMMEVREMSKIALERTATARDAVKLMGSLAEQYGFYGADWSGGDMSLGEAGEALTVIDKDEAWVFHVLADDSGSSAVWVAQRVPDDHVSAVANQFVIRDVTKNSPDFLYSSNLWEVAERHGLWSEKDGKPLDFLLTYAPNRAHSPYATRRVWRVFNMVAPSFVLSPYTDAYGSNYPFSVKADKKLDPKDIMKINRDHYEGTEFDLTKGLAAGPYGDPNRFDQTPVDGLTFMDILQGSYERAISLFRTSYSFVAVARDSVPNELGLLWFSQYAPSSSSYAPFYVSSEHAPRAYTRGSLFQYSSESSFWNFCAAGNYASRFYMYAMQEIFSLQMSLQNEAEVSIQKTEEAVMRVLKGVSGAGAITPEERKKSVVSLLTTFTDEQANKIVSAWRDLLPTLITKYHDGYRAEKLTEKEIHMQKLFYPKAWLEATGFFDAKNKPNTGPNTILFAPNAHSNSALLLTALVSSMLSVLAGIFLTRHFMFSNPDAKLNLLGVARKGYSPISDSSVHGNEKNAVEMMRGSNNL